MIDKAKELVQRYVDEHTDRSNPEAEPTLFVVWQATILDNFKCLIATTLPYGMHFEMTYDGDRKCWYMDVYRKVKNVEIADV